MCNAVIELEILYRLPLPWSLRQAPNADPLAPQLPPHHPVGHFEDSNCDVSVALLHWGFSLDYLTGMGRYCLTLRAGTVCCHYSATARPPCSWQGSLLDLVSYIHSMPLQTIRAFCRWRSRMQCSPSKNSSSNSSSSRSGLT